MQGTQREEMKPQINTDGHRLIKNLLNLENNLKSEILSLSAFIRVNLRLNFLKNLCVEKNAL